MVDRIVIEDPQLAQRIQSIAERERRSVEDVLASMLAQYELPALGRDAPKAEDLARRVRLAAYERARDYWRRVGDEERAAMTDEQLDQEFWLFDEERIPRLKADRDEVRVAESSLHRAGQALRAADFHSGQSDISAGSREILDEEFADYLLNRPGDHVSHSD
jgi:hypothetical protein